ncbi:hypothetical protein [Paenibacillus camerounensis]|uniref:hypothetical protein n=1 Tax=Paenibacillus camerounensis TaxID=1243663 RepID=UPI0006938F4D|nr:hypothetical protein [Paenibacillus camerounensis]
MLTRVGISGTLVFITRFIPGSTGVSPKEQGSASAVINTGLQIGGAIALAVIMAIISASLGSNSKMEILNPELLNHSIKIVFSVSTVVTLFGITVSITALKRARGGKEGGVIRIC